LGERVGVGWHGGHYFVCDSCRRGDFVNCSSAMVTSVGSDGGWADYMVTSIHALARIPDGIEFVEAGPLMCAGVTTFNALRHCGAWAGKAAAILGSLTA
jgi:D-arabinose 1-dehydrogenase-like Zn-dependent alcohol dehydrogenase